MTLINYALDNGFIFWAGFAGMGGFISYKFVTTYLNSFYLDKGVQTEAWEDYSDRPSQIGSGSTTSIETVTPILENISPVFSANSTSEIGTQTITDSISTVTTVLPIPPVNIETVPNADITLVTKSLVDQGVQTINNPESIISMTEIDLIDLLNSPIKPLDSMMADEWAIDYEWDAEDLIKIASFFAN